MIATRSEMKEEKSQPTARVSYAIPVAYILLDSVKALFTEGLNTISPLKRGKNSDLNFIQGPFINPVIVLWVELLKLVASAFIVFRYGIRVEWKQSYLFFVLTFLFYVNNNLYLTAFRYASAPAIQLLLYVKIPATVVLHHFFIKAQKRKKPWILLSFLLLGALISQITDKFEVTNQSVVIICLVLSMNSALASIYTEKLLKSLDMNFWSQQVILKKLMHYSRS